MKKTKIPRHVAIIMDGNRRWAKKRGLPTFMGHKRVVDGVLEPLVEHAADLGIEYLTFWTWSTENWNRSRFEVGAIMKLFRLALKKYGQKLVKKGARIRVIGNLEGFPKDIREGVEELVEESAKNRRINLEFALNYGGRDEILRAINKLLEDKSKIPPTASQFRRAGKNQKLKITEKELEKYLDTVGMPDPDLIIRTGGEQRLSGFMPWQSVYSEFYFPEVLMPDFTPEELDRALEVYATRQRRFGK